MPASSQQIDRLGDANCPVVEEDFRSAYIELLKRSLCNLLHIETEIRPKRDNNALRKGLVAVVNGLSSQQSELILVDKEPADCELRLEGRDWPVSGHTMVGLKRLNNIEFCLDRIFEDRIPGDLIEAGVWRGGSSILMEAILATRREADRRTLWLADSFQGLPRPNEDKCPADKGLSLYRFHELAVPLEQVMANFERYGLLKQNVRFLKGWFSETLPTAPIERLALIRADGDLYESTADILNNLYPKLSPGGFVIIDDYHIPACRQAVHEYRDTHGIEDPIVDIDWTGAYWRKAG